MPIWPPRSRVQADGVRDRADKMRSMAINFFARRKERVGTYNKAIISLRLPPELFLLIFDLAVHAQFSSGQNSKQRLTCISVSRVCQYWRQLTLDCPAIWSCIDTSWSSLAIEFVRRSRAAPLTVVVQLTHRPSIAVVAAINVVLGERQIERIRELRVSADDMIHLELNFCHRIHASKLLALSLHSTPRAIRVTPPPFPWILPETLKTLVVSTSYIPQDPQMLRNLTQLKVTGDSRPPGFSLRVFDIITILQMCPVLEEFDYFTICYVDYMTPPHITAELLCLRHIRLKINSRACQMLLSRLIFGATVTFGIDVSRHWEKPEVHTTFSFGNYDALDLRVTYDGYLRMKAYNLTGDENQRTAAFHNISTLNPYNGSIEFTSLKIYFDAILPQVRSLSIHFDSNKIIAHPYIRRILWTDILMDLPSVLSLTIKVGSHNEMLPPTDIVVSLMQALRKKDAHKRLCLCHNLRTFVLDGIPFTEADGKAALSYLKSFAAAREVGEARIATIDISNCIGVKYRNVQALENFVDEVIWKWWSDESSQPSEV
ncbi:hypothetical protein BD410DRAFT_795870 [Rickenella mellea]|uniref:Uncharacterized protein n=1 Tax=Rickenella mellea TaxID=50990 RepID=A0A4Y7PLS8_9AGAM|nr:hypothetical protein BD410DRAFT_795870 [Rickenella mellea]